ncbi:MAG: hypothetical protein LBT88_05650 [Oscillospiraceae bacterium]|jgi:hypothetical protein|nr:hypothetical protein [Oscillospiraceae bacterium]
MNSVKTQAFNAFDLLTEREQFLVFELIKSLAPDDIATADDIAAHDAAIEDYARGECVSHEDINWD